MNTTIRTSLLTLLLMALVLPMGCARTGHVEGDNIEAASEADAQFAAGADKAPTPHTFYAMARILDRMQRHGESEQLLARALRLYPDYIPLYCKLAEVRMQQNRMHDALQTLQVGLQKAPDHPILLNNAGMCSLFQDDYAAAADYFLRACGNQPANARYRTNLAMSLALLGRYDEAYALYAQVLPKSRAHHNLGVICQAQGNADRARNEFALAQSQP